MVGISIHETLVAAATRLSRIGTDRPRLEAEILFRHTLGLGTREFLLLDRQTPLDSDASHRFEGFIERRLAREPWQYIVGSAQFCEFEFEVGPGVLIPRPETEVLVERLSILLAPQSDEAVALIDVGTGSGAIALTLLARHPKWVGCGLDVSAKALSWAARNAEALEVRGRFQPVRTDLLSSLRRDAGVGLLVSNPPYIPRAELALLEPEVRDHEPHSALEGGDDGLLHTRRLIDQAADVLREGALLALELGLGQVESVRGHAERRGFRCLEGYRDLTGRERGLILRR